MSLYQFRWVGFASLLYTVISAIAPYSVRAEVPLTRASVEALANEVELLPEAGTARPAQLSDWLGIGDAIRTAVSARVDLRFNDGSLARIGEQATFRFVPDTRTFRLSNGTALFLIPPGQGPSTIETPGAVTGIQGTGLIVRYIPAVPDGHVNSDAQPSQSEPEVTLGRTVVMVLTDNPQGPVEVSLSNGRTAELAAGEMAIVDGDELSVFEFDLALFYETSSLVEDLYLDDPNYSGSGQPTDPVRQETLQGLENQWDFEGEYLLDPEAVNPGGISPIAETDWLVPLGDDDNAANPVVGQNDNPMPTVVTSDSESEGSEAIVTAPSTTSEETTTTSPISEETTPTTSSLSAEDEEAVTHSSSSNLPSEGTAPASPPPSTESNASETAVTEPISSLEPEAPTPELVPGTLAPDAPAPELAPETPAPEISDSFAPDSAELLAPDSAELLVPDSAELLAPDSASLAPDGASIPVEESITPSSLIPPDFIEPSPEETLDNGSDNNPGSDNPGTDPIDNPGTDPIDNPGTDPIDNPGTDPIDNPGTDPIDNPGTDPIDNPGTDPIDNPGTDPIDNPGTDPIDNPGTDPIDNPGTDPVDNPGTDPIDNPGTDPIDNPGADPIDNPGTDPVDNPGTDPVDNPGTDPIDNPGTGPIDNPDNGLIEDSINEAI
ncbi:MAG: FecR domain-containing protein [Cyanobacteria bacterium P01_F01_bin.86]